MENVPVEYKAELAHDTNIEISAELEAYLKDVHAEGYMGTDDDMPEAFELWLSKLSQVELELYAEKIK